MIATSWTRRTRLVLAIDHSGRGIQLGFGAVTMMLAAASRKLMIVYPPQP
jgi:hypothetical protein